MWGYPWLNFVRGQSFLSDSIIDSIEDTLADWSAVLEGEFPTSSPEDTWTYKGVNNNTY